MNQTAPDVVISDVIMPEKDGYEVCQYIKQHSALAKTPVILMSGVVNRSVAERAFAVKADELIRKPFQPQDLINRVRHLLHSKNEAAPAAAPAPSATMAALSNIFQTVPSTRTHSRPSLAVVPRPAIQVPAAETAFPLAGVMPSAVAVGESAATPALAPASAKTAHAGDTRPASPASFDVAFAEVQTMPAISSLGPSDATAAFAGNPMEEPLAELYSALAGEAQSPVADLAPSRTAAALSGDPVSAPTKTTEPPANVSTVSQASVASTAEARPPAQPAAAERRPRVPEPPALQPAKIRLELLRLQSQIKKLEAELAAEREYARALEEHIKTLQEVE
jgi:hypothetical protein